ncbi:MAG: hypothetical protein ACYTFG_05890, partial [Planctomycetota bacterium]
MRFPPIAAVLLASLLIVSGLHAQDGELIDKVSKAYGKSDAFSSAKGFSMVAVLKWMGGGLAKYDYYVDVRYPKDFSSYLEGFDGTFGTQGRLVLGDRGWSYQKEVPRPMAPDEVASAHRSITDFDWLGRLKRGELKFEILPDTEFEGVGFASIRLLGEEDREIKLHFDKETWLLHRRDETVTNRDGSQSSEYTIYEEYEDFDGFKIAVLEKTYVNQIIKGTEKKEKFQLVQKVEIDEFNFSPEFEEGVFDEPPDPFTVEGLSAADAEKRAEELLKFFKGRKNPNQAGWACRALAKMQARSAIKKLMESDNKEVAHYGYLAQIRMGS